MGEGLAVDAELDLRVGRIETALEKVGKWLHQTTNWPRYLSASGTCITDGSGNGLIQMGPVAQGRRWIVHQLVVGGTYWSTVVTGSALVFILPSWSSADVQVPLVAVQDEASGTNPPLPSVAFYGRGQCVVPGMNSLWIMITGGGSGVVYSASCDYVDEPAGS